MSQSPKEIADKILNCKTYNTTEMQTLARAYLELEKKLQVTNNNWPHEKKLHDEITKLKKSREGLRTALEHTWPGSAYAIDVDAFNRNALKADDELMG